jgi:hypothetical protein
VLEGLLHPHSSIPWVQTGLIIALYMVIFVSRGSCDFVFISRFIYQTLSSNCLLLCSNMSLDMSWLFNDTMQLNKLHGGGVE